MSDSITQCIEEEYSFCLSYLWRRKAGWYPIFLSFRGPAGIPFFITPFLTLIGLWRFARTPIRLADTDTQTFMGATVTQISSSLGSYGMGGPGFVGLHLRLPDGRSVWVVFTIWAAAEWLTIGDGLVSDGYFPDEQRELPGSRGFRPLSDLVGATLTDIILEPDILKLTFRASSELLILKLQRDSSSLPVHRGSKEPKFLLPSQDVRDALITSRRASLWLID